MSGVRPRSKAFGEKETSHQPCHQILGEEQAHTTIMLPMLLILTILMMLIMLMMLMMQIFNDVYFKIASVIQLEILRRLANFTFHENYLSSQSTFGQSYIVIFAK